MTPTRKLVLLCSVLLVAACAPAKRDVAPRGPALRVAVTPGNPPYVFDQGGQLVGLEVDFARELANALGRPLKLVPLAWEELIPGVRGRDADIIMAGMTITAARQVQIAFSEPYLRSGLIAVARRSDVDRFKTNDAVLRTREQVGVVARTTSERFVRDHMTAATVKLYPDIQAAIDELRQRRVTLVVHDAPIAIWYTGGDEGDLGVAGKLLNEEPLGWGMRRDDDALRSGVDAALARWRTDGTRDRILGRWLPYWQRLESRSAER